MANVNGFLAELAVLLAEYNAAIVRSADDNHNLVVSVDDSSNGFDEVEFEEDITFESLHNEWFKELAKSE
jgi:hypothetical protein